ncbi:MAG: sensor histidine kinase, partial [Nannocystaceae bacterium]
ELASSLSFRERATSNEPLTILLAGVVIDSLLLIFFLFLARSNQRLMHSNRALDEQAERLHASNVELEQFAFVASHDLQEPLRMVRSYVGILDKQLPQPRSSLVEKSIGYVVDGSSRMQGLIEDLLEFSRAGRKNGELGRVELSEVIANVRTDLSVALEERGGIFESDDLPAVLGNQAALHQLFLNLISNALKFNRSDTPRVEIRVTHVGGHCEIAVKDNGIGIPKDKQEVVFGPFKRLHVRSEFKGNGIGLAVCAKIVARHGGTIALDSAPGAGSTFRVYLPLAPTETSA